MISGDPCVDVRIVRTTRSSEMFAECDFTCARIWATNQPMRYRIRELRKAREWTVQQLADRVGTSKGHISGIETGAREPSTVMLADIAEALNVPVPELYEARSPQEAEAIAHFVTFLDLGDDDRASVIRHARALHDKGD